MENTNIDIVTLRKQALRKSVNNQPCPVAMREALEELCRSQYPINVRAIANKALEPR